MVNLFIYLVLLIKYILHFFCLDLSIECFALLLYIHYCFYTAIVLTPLDFIIAFSGLELGIAFIQAQVLVVLSSGYIKDGLDLH